VVVRLRHIEEFVQHDHRHGVRSVIVWNSVAVLRGFVTHSRGIHVVRALLNLSTGNPGHQNNSKEIRFHGSPLLTVLAALALLHCRLNWLTVRIVPCYACGCVLVLSTQQSSALLRCSHPAPEAPWLGHRQRPEAIGDARGAKALQLLSTV
jgi:hypothetical protein